MSHPKSREVVLAIELTGELQQALDALRKAWKLDPATIPKGLSGSETKEGVFTLVAAEAAFTTLPGACVIKGLGAIHLLGDEPAFEPGASSKTLLLKEMPDGWRFSVKYVAPIIRERNIK
ncbi:MAG: hypothetical protein H6R15_3558 [Proteobacteria bacterium]|nr:hypothetical protein [Pseudomonadota bacterium]